MAHTITSGATVITPTAVDEYESSATPGTIIHEIINREDPDVTLRPASLRRGVLNLSFRTDAASRAAEEALATPGVWTWDAPVASVGMTFVVAGGDLGRRMMTTGRWLVTVPFVEVAP